MDRIRRTMMFIPGNSPSMLNDAYIYHPDSIMMDLEDAVSINEKDSARVLVHNALKYVNYGDIEKIVRINSLKTSYGMKDIEAVILAGVDVIRLPKTDVASDVIEAEQIINEIERKYNCQKRTLIMAAIESAKGVINAVEIALASNRLMGIALGAEDYITDLKTSRTKQGMELFLARSQIVLAARNARIACFDTVNTNLSDIDQFEEEVKFIKDLGFDGKSIIHPNQIDIVNKIYTPTEEEINSAIRIVIEMENATKEGKGVLSIDGKMVDKPVILRAENTIKLAIASGVLEEKDVYGV